VAADSLAVFNNLLILEIVIVVFSVMISVGMAVMVTKGVTTPLKKLQNAMYRVERNHLDEQVTVDTNDELGYLTEGFNQMMAGLRQVEQLRTLLNLYVTPELAREALEHAAILEGQMVESSVLFADIRDFTALTNHMEPEQIIQLLNRYMEGMVEVVVNHGGLVTKFSGDSLMVVFGTPLNPANDHAVRALKAARAMLEWLAIFNREQCTFGEPEVQIGIGVATGRVVAGNLGKKERIEYTVIGPTVDLAAFLQGMTFETGDVILASAATVEKVGPVVGLQNIALPGMKMHGKDEMMPVYAVQPLRLSLRG
jgi:adenylate cyclase